MIDIEDMAKVCESCSNYHHADSLQDDDGCMLKRPLSNCPYLLGVYALPDKWRTAPEKEVWVDHPIKGEGWLKMIGWKGNETHQKCADELEGAFENV